jgi:hypothetical protein
LLHNGFQDRRLKPLGHLSKEPGIEMVAERVGFEPTEQLPTRFLSKEVLSATQPSLHTRLATYQKFVGNGNGFLLGEEGVSFS